MATAIAQSAIRDLRYRSHKIRERCFDTIHNCNTAGDARTDSSLYEGALSGSCERYEATPIGVFDRCMRLLMPHELKPENCTFYDIGCGKGRVLLEAMKYKFLRVEGADISAALVETARTNIANARFLGRRCGPISVIQTKAEDIRFGDQDALIYLFHPFDITLMNLFVASMLRQLWAQKRAAHILYYNPVCQRLFDESAHFEKVLRLDRIPLWSDEHACALAIYKFKCR